MTTRGTFMCPECHSGKMSLDTKATYKAIFKCTSCQFTIKVNKTCALCNKGLTVGEKSPGVIFCLSCRHTCTELQDNGFQVMSYFLSNITDVQLQKHFEYVQIELDKRSKEPKT